MDAGKVARELLAAGRELREVEEGIWSALGEGAGEAGYDRLAAGYDRLVWGNVPGDYADFARQATASPADDPFLDAGCGSLLFTAGVYRTARRPIVALDRSVGMLRRARGRLADRRGRLPAHIALVQGDLFDLPFRPASLPTIMGMGWLHLFADPAPVVAGLARLLTPGGRLLLTGLVTRGRGPGDHWLAWLRRRGQVEALRSAREVEALVSGATGWPVRCAVRGNMAYLKAESHS